jgi:hypothetical protein
MTQKKLTDVQKMLSAVDEAVSARLFLQGTGSRSQLIGLLTEYGRSLGFHLDRGDRVIIHPDNVPANVPFYQKDPVLVSTTAPRDQLLFTRNPLNR